MIHIVIIATNMYMVLGIRFIKQLNANYKGSEKLWIHLFTDVDVQNYLPSDTKNVTVYHKKHSDWVEGVNSKFFNILSIEKNICQTNNDVCYFFDADTSCHSNFTENFFDCNGLVCGEHYSNAQFKLSVMPYDRNMRSACYVPIKTKKKQYYYYGAFFGGRSDKMIKLCIKLQKLQEINKKRRVEPVWNDESYLNYYFHYNPPEKMIECADFDKIFKISDKGGLTNTRDSSQKLSDENISKLIEYREKSINLVKGDVVLV
jgi:hypothetical protein